MHGGGVEKKKKHYLVENSTINEMRLNSTLVDTIVVGRCGRAECYGNMGRFKMSIVGLYCFDAELQIMCSKLFEIGYVKSFILADRKYLSDLFR